MFDRATFIQTKYKMGLLFVQHMNKLQPRLSSSSSNCDTNRTRIVELNLRPRLQSGPCFLGSSIGLRVASSTPSAALSRSHGCYDLSSMANLLLGLGTNSARFFDGSRGNVVQLIEVWGQQNATHAVVTNDLIHTYITRDFPCITTPSRGDCLKFLYGLGSPLSPFANLTLEYSFSVRQGEYDGNMIPIPISQLSYDKIAPFARIPSIFPDILFRKSAMAVYATPQIPQTNPSAKIGISQASTRQEYICNYNETFCKAIP